MSETTQKPLDLPSRSTLGGFVTWLRGLFANGSDASLRESLEDVIEQHDEANRDFTAEQRSMLVNLLGFGEKRVEDVMVPRADITAVEKAVPMDELMRVFHDAGHSRLPVFAETLDEPIGMVHIKDVMGWITAVAGKPASSGAKNGQKRKPDSLRLDKVNLAKPLTRMRLIRDVLFVPPSMPAVDLLVKMQATRIHMAIVVDEYGGTDGLVSIEDLVEEIVGEIEDEHDADDGPLIVEDGPDHYVADARALIDEIVSLKGLGPLSERDEDIDTVGGLVFSTIGRVPVRGELIRHDSGIEFEVLDADPRRLRRLRIHLPSAHKP
jgi:CBS domain containing-hemolysin-like protein